MSWFLPQRSGAGAGAQPTIGSPGGKGTLGTWHNHYRRRAAAGAALERFAAEMGDASVPAPDLAEQICACVSRLAATLKPDYAEALRRIDVEGMAVKDFAAMAGITPGNAGARVFHARQALRSQLIASCGTCAEHGCLDCSCGRLGPAGRH